MGICISNTVINKQCYFSTAQRNASKERLVSLVITVPFLLSVLCRPTHTQTPLRTTSVLSRSSHLLNPTGFLDLSTVADFRVCLEGVPAPKLNRCVLSLPV
jgi:hypothetical protein